MLPMTLEGTPMKLPPELWSEILRLATDVPYALDTNIANTHPFAHDGAYLVDLLPDSKYHSHPLTAAQKTMRTLALTCRAFCGEITPRLYSIPLCRSLDAVAALHRTLVDDGKQVRAAKARATRAKKKGKATAGAATIQLKASYIRWLYIHPHYNAFGRTTEPDPQKIKAVAEMIKLASGLQSLTIAWRNERFETLPPSWVTAICAKGASLQKLHIDGIPPREDDTATILDACSELRTFFLTRANELEDPVRFPVDELLDHDTLSSFSVRPLWYRGNTPPEQTPNPEVTQVHFGVGYGPERVDRALANTQRAAFLRKQGAHITVAYVGIEFSSFRPLDTEAQDVLNLLARFCPNLTTLVWLVPSVWQVPREMKLPETVTHMGIKSNSPWCKCSNWFGLYQDLAAMTPALAPKLEIVRMLDPTLSETFDDLEDVELDIIVQYVRKIRFRVEDCNGDIFLDESWGMEDGRDEWARDCVRNGGEEAPGSGQEASGSGPQ